MADDSLVESINQLINQVDGSVRDRLDQPVETTIDGGLVDQAGRWLYPIRKGIPTLIAEQAIQLKENAE